MELMRLGLPGKERPVLRKSGMYYDISGVTDDITPDFFREDGLARVRAAMLAGTLPVFAGASELRVGAPIARPGAVLCIGLNYAAHAAESGQPAPDHPILFFKHPNCLAGPNDTVPLPTGATQVDWEVELAIVIGKPAYRIASPEAAAGYIAGFTLADDLSEREFQLKRSGSQWGKGKSCPGFLPLGPALATPDHCPPDALGIRSWVNGQLRQNSSTRDMIFDVNTLVHDLSQYLRLDAGDLILTGTPEGVALSGRFPYLASGDIVEVEIDCLGRQRHVIDSDAG